MKIGPVVALTALIAVATAPVNAGLFSSGVSDADLSAIKRMGVISALGDTLMVRSQGLTVFNNTTFKGTLPNRDLDAFFAKDLKSIIVASGRIKGDVSILNTRALDTESIVSAAREQGFDTVVLMKPAEDTQFHMTGPGLTVWRTGGGHKSFTCNSMQVV